MHRLEGLVQKMSGFSSLLSGIALSLLLGLTVVDVLMRNLAGSPLRGTIAYTELALVVVVYMAIPRVEAENRNITVTLIVDRMPGHFRPIVGGIAKVLTSITVALLLWSTSQQVLTSYTSNASRPGTDFPTWPARLLIALGFLLLLPAVIVSLNGRAEEEVTGSEGPPVEGTPL